MRQGGPASARDSIAGDSAAPRRGLTGRTSRVARRCGARAGATARTEARAPRGRARTCSRRRDLPRDRDMEERRRKRDGHALVAIRWEDETSASRTGEVMFSDANVRRCGRREDPSRVRASALPTRGVVDGQFRDSPRRFECPALCHGHAWWLARSRELPRRGGGALYCVRNPKPGVGEQQRDTLSRRYGSPQATGARDRS